jgi:hypothetical protein
LSYWRCSRGGGGLGLSLIIAIAHVTAAILLSALARVSCFRPALRALGVANGSGVSDTTGLPTKLGPDKNVAWKLELPFSRSSPIVVGDSVFVTSFEDEKLLTFRIESETGNIVWRKEIVRPRAADIFESNDPASPGPVSDGRNVYVFFADLGLVSYARDGTERWRTPRHDLCFWEITLITK